MGVDAADEHAVFLYDAPAGGGFTGAGEDAFVAGFSEEGEEAC